MTEIRELTPRYEGDTLIYTITSKRRNIKPSSGLSWDSLVKKILDYQVLNTAKPFIEEEGPVLHAPTTISFEIATVGKYREYQYWHPSAYQGKYWQVNEVNILLDILKRELDFSI